MKILTEARAQPSGFQILKLWTPRVAASALFFFIGKSKFAAHSEWVGIFNLIGFGQWFRYFTGAVQMIGALLLLSPRSFVFGILILVCTMFGAILADVLLISPVFAMVPLAILLGLGFIGGEELIDLYDRLRNSRQRSGPRQG